MKAVSLLSYQAGVRLRKFCWRRTAFVLSSASLAKYSMLLVAMRLGDTPVPIPNTTVKTREADGTALETVWESRWLPD